MGECSGSGEAVAIIGLSCRVPGGENPAEFWESLRSGRDAVRAVPDWRRAALGLDEERAELGGWLEDVDRFDAGFFGLSPREALAADPQQRLALELSWQAAESAGLGRDALRGSRTGVFVGAIWDDYAELTRDLDTGHHGMTGLHRSMIANRVSYAFGMRGPSLTVDSGQSSSLVAVHLACESLRRGESDAAFAGGVNLVLSRSSAQRSADFGGLSAQGRCRVWDAAADGYVRGEGGALVVLKPLDRALADGDPVHAVVLGSAVGNDGETDTLTTPSATAQAETVRAACANAGISPAELDYVELHGTGTPVGDPLEAAGLGRARGRAEAPLRVGSVKTNIGHLEGAAGVAGLVKTVLALQHRELPPSLHFDTANSQIPLEELGLAVQSELSPWPGSGRAVAGVSSFGMGGTNCHVVLAEGRPAVFSPDAAPAAPERAQVPWPLSARSASALAAAAEQLVPWAGSPAAVASALARRDAFEHRAVVLAGSSTAARLAHLADPEDLSTAVGVVRGTGRTRPRTSPVFVFPGQGTQWGGMGAELYWSSRVFRARFTECSRALERAGGPSAVDVVTAGRDLDDVGVLQPVTWAVMVSLAALWESAGVEPAAVIGHSQGEIAAAVVAGSLSLDQGARVSTVRAAALRGIAGTGAMASIALPAAELEPHLGAGVVVATVNGPSSTVVSGSVAAVDGLLARLEAEDVRCRRIAVDYGSHSPDVEPLRAELLAGLADVEPAPTTVSWWSTTRGTWMDGTGADADYWYANLRERVRFTEGIADLIALGHDAFVEVSAHPVLVPGIEATAEAGEHDVAAVGTLRRDEGSWEQVLTACAQAWVDGIDVRWERLAPEPDGPRVVLPPYPFRGRSFWPQELPPAPDQRARPTAAAEPVPELAGRIAGLSAAEGRSLLVDVVRRQVCDLLEHERPSDVDVRSTFRDLGFDSITGVQLRDRLAQAVGERLPSSLLHDQPTPQRLAAWLRDRLAGEAADEHVAQAVGTADDPVVVVGTGCRLPGGVSTPEQFWDLLEGGLDAISAFPTDRGWDLDGLYDPDPDQDGTCYTRHGGFLHDAGEFDAEFFGISPREALAMDPQQRLLLETSWETLERAGIDPHSLRGSRTGVFAGAMAQEYGSDSGAATEGYALTGTSPSVLSGRLSYALGLEGPALTVDTACSSSLVALHLAAQSLRNGECDAALVGGATVMATPKHFVEFSRQRGLAEDGRCKPFSADADGTGWAEGVGVLLVERLSTARARGHRVLAVVRGSAVNQDGASNGLTAPNGPAQQRVIREALARSGLRPSDVDAVEAHGTGTSLGDPIEAHAILATYGQNRSEPLKLGSAKSNIGHAQAAAGVTGVVKMVLALQHEQLPRTLHVREPSPHVEWDSGSVELLREPAAWPAGDTPRRAGVSSFGISGTNAHVILEQAPAVEAGTADTASEEPADAASLFSSEAELVPWRLSARTPAALSAMADRILPLVEADCDAGAVGAALAKRSEFEHRAVVLADPNDPEQAAGALRALAEGDEWESANTPGLVRGPGAVTEDPPRPVFVFPGQGAQWEGMGRELLHSSPVFADKLRECSQALQPHLGVSIVDVLDQQQPLDDVAIVQPASWAVMVSLAHWWQTAGIHPSAVIGHSQGEIAAAHIAGVLSLADSARIVATRAKLLQRLTGTGSMASLALPEDQAREFLQQHPQVHIAVINSPHAVIAAGPTDALDTALHHAEQQGVRVRRVDVTYASHTPAITPLETELTSELNGITHQSPTIPWISTTTGEWVTEPPEPTYWFTNLQQPVHFANTLQTLLTTGHTHYLETSSHPVLTPHLHTTAEHHEIPIATTTSLTRNDDTPQHLATHLAHTWTTGQHPTAPTHPKPAELPTYPFQRSTYWLAPARTGSAPRTPDRYSVAWRPVDVPEAPALEGRWLVLAPENPDFSQQVSGCVNALRQHGAEVVEVTVPVDQLSRADVAATLTRTEPDGVLSLLALESPRGPGTNPSTTATLACLQGLVDSGRTTALWCATTGGSPAQSQIWGLGRVAALEHPALWGGLVELPQRVGERTGQLLAAALAGVGEDQVALGDDGLLARRLVPAADRPENPWTPRGTALITGGTGALGAHVARWLASSGAEHLVLTSRSAGGADELRAELEDLGARVTLASCDVAERDQLAAVLAEHPPTAAVHAAGAVELTPLDQLTAEELDEVLRAKVAGAENLHALLPAELDAFVLFSSIAGVWGVADHGAYAAANAHLDALAEHRAQLGLPAVSIAWGPWAGGGMIADELRDVLAQRGVPLLDPDAAMPRLRESVERGEPTTAVADVRWSRFCEVFASSRPSQLFREIPELQQEAREPDSELAVQLRSLDRAEQHRHLLDLVRKHAAAVLGRSDLDPGRSFSDAGFDSLTAVELRDRLRAAAGTRLPATLLYDHPTPERLATWLRGELLGETERVEVRRSGGSGGDPIAVVGMACRFPGGIRTPEDLWRLLVDGGEVISGMPSNRGWDLGGLYDPDPDHEGTSYVREGGFLHDAGEFDAGFFDISPREAVSADPQQRLLLETAWESVESTGTDPRALRGSRTGVFSGVTDQRYVDQLRGTEGAEGHMVTGAVSSVASGRVAYALGLEGPAITIDTACSSSLVALHLAAQALRNGECDAALAGGAMVMSTPDQFLGFSRQRGLAADGRCKPFSEDADGFSLSEGVGVFFVERLSEARAQGHPVLAVMRGSAVNQDGASNGLTAPNGPSQQRVIRDALANAELDPSDVDVVEAHGTGTALGDPIEAHALLATYGHTREQPLLLGSVKSNLGHTQAASGVAGVMKMILALQHEQLPKTLHIGEPSSRIDWNGGAVRLLREDADWPAHEQPRRAAVSSFGVSGTNAHVILEEPPTPEVRDVPAGPALFAADVGIVPWRLSARTPRALSAMAGQLASATEEADPGAVGAALAKRSEFEHRAVVLADPNDPEQALDALRALASGDEGADAPGLVVGSEAVTEDPPPPVFVFPGQGAQWEGMGRSLLHSSPVFADKLRECSQALQPHLGVSIVDVLDQQQPLDDVAIVQPASWAVMVSLAHWWQQAGIHPSAVIGHSQGEIAAAHIAGVLSLDDSARIVATRATLLRRLTGTGSMASLALPEDQAREFLQQHPQVHIAVINSPHAVIAAGPTHALDTALHHAEQQGVRVRRIDVTYASHTPSINELQTDLTHELTDITHHTPTIPWISTTTGEWVTTPPEPTYWFTNLQQPVHFASTLQTLLNTGHTHYLETSSHPVLTPHLHTTAEHHEIPITTTTSLTRNDDNPHHLAAHLAHTWTTGQHPAAPTHPKPAELPTYPFQRTHYWPAPTTTRAFATAPSTNRYAVDWVPAENPSTPRAHGSLLLVVPNAGTDPLAAQLESAAQLSGCDVVTLAVGPDDSRETLGKRLLDVLTADTAGIASLLPCAEGDHPDQAGISTALASSTLLVQALTDIASTAPLWFLTRSAVSVAGEEPDPRAAQLWGLGLVLSLDHPKTWGGLLDLPADLDERAAEGAVRIVLGGSDEDQLALRGSRLHARRMVRPDPAPRKPWRPRGTVLITGGTGALGAHTARWLARNGADHLLLTSRSGPDAAGAAELRAELEDLGARVTIAACDVADATQLDEVLAGHEITAVFHTAGAVGAERDLSECALSDIAATLRGKVAGADNLDRALGDVDAFVLYSSGAAIWGNAGQAPYTAANAHLDALARARRARGRTAASVAWGAWNAGGMVDEDTAASLRARGVLEMDPERALAALDDVLAEDVAHAVVAEFDWDLFSSLYSMSRHRPLVDVLTTRQRETPEDEPEFADRLAAATPEEQHRQLLDLVRRTAAEVLGHEPSAIGPRRPFTDLGFESLTALQFRNRLGAACGRKLPAAVAYDHPTPTALAEHLRELLVPHHDPAAELVEHLDAALAAAPPGGDEQARLVERMRSLLAHYGASGETDADLDGATDDEMFELIDQEIDQEFRVT